MWGDTTTLPNGSTSESEREREAQGEERVTYSQLGTVCTEYKLRTGYSCRREGEVGTRIIRIYLGCTYSYRTTLSPAARQNITTCQARVYDDDKHTNTKRTISCESSLVLCRITWLELGNDTKPRSPPTPLPDSWLMSGTTRAR